MSSSSATAIVARNTTYQFLGKALAIGLSMITFTLVARTLSADQYGYFTVISTIFALIIGLTDLKVDQIAVRQAAEHPDQLGTQAGQATIVKLIFSVAILIAATIVIYFSSYHPVIKITSAMVFIGVLFNALQTGWLVIIQHNLQAYIFAVAEVISKAIATVLVVLVTWQAVQMGSISDNLVTRYAVIMLLIAPIIVCLVYYAATRSKERLVWSISWAQVAGILKETWPLWMIGVISIVHYRADTLILAMLQPDYDVGIYGLPYRLLDVTVTLPPMFVASIYPLLSRYVLSDKPRADRALVKSFNFILMFSALLAVVIIYASPQLVALFGGLKYTESIGVLRILSIAMVSSYLGTVLAPYFIAYRQQRLLMLLLLIPLAVNLSLSFALIPSLTYNGAAIATAISETVGMLLVGIVLVIKYKVKFSGWLILKVGASAAVAFAILQVTGLSSYTSASFLGNLGHIIIISLLACLVYVAGLVVTRTLNRELVRESLVMLPVPAKIKNIF